MLDWAVPNWRSKPDPATVVAVMSQQAVWDPGQYHQYGCLRLRPAPELLSRVSIASPSLVHDIGTGGGDVARLMTERWPNARVVGSDSSPEMLDTAASTASTVEWRLLDLSEWQPAAEHDVIYGNAVLHWVDNHEEILPRLIGGLRPGGELALQIPMSWWQPSHQIIRDTLASLAGPQARALSTSMAKPNVHQPSRYYEILQPIVTEIDIWETTFQQILRGDDPVFEWVSGSILRPVFTQLPTDEADRFSELCRRALREAYPPRRDGTTLFPFHRLFIVARP